MTQRHWIAVASAEHVMLGRQQGFMQVCHGKAAPLRRLGAGDSVAYYSPERQFRSKDGLQAFTAFGQVMAGDPYQVAMSEGFHPWRKNVAWQTARETPIRPLLGRLTFAQGNRNWGYQFRFGLFEIDGADAEVIEAAMRITDQHDIARRSAHGDHVGQDRHRLGEFCCDTFFGLFVHAFSLTPKYFSAYRQGAPIKNPSPYRPGAVECEGGGGRPRRSGLGTAVGTAERLPGQE